MNNEDFKKEFAHHPFYRAPRGSLLHAKSWQTEAPLRMLLNNLDEEVAEDPSRLIVYGGTGQAARDIPSLDKIIDALLNLEENESLLIQSGKPVGIIPTHQEAPRVLIANSNLVPAWANWEHFNYLKNKNLMMYGQMTAGSWIYIGSQGILQGTYETFASIAKTHFSNSLKGTLTVTGGLGGMGGAQPLAVTMNEGVLIGVDVDAHRIVKRLKTKYIDCMTDNYEEAIHLAIKAKNEKKSLSIGLVGNIIDFLEKLIANNITPDIATDQTSAHDPLNGYIPMNFSLESAKQLRDSNPKAYKELSLKSMAKHVHLLLELKKRGSIVFDYGNNLREFAHQGGEENAFEIKGFVPEYIRPLFCEGKGPFRWVALSGEEEDIYLCDKTLKNLFPENKHLHQWLDQAQKKIAFQGLPARICWLGYGERLSAGLAFNKLVKEKRLAGPIVIGRDHLDAGSVASPYRETEKMLDGSDAVSDWPLLNLLGNCSGGATWVSFHHGGGVGIGYSQHAGMVILADGTERAERCLKRVLAIDPMLGVIRHHDAGYTLAKECAEKFQLKTYDTL